MNTEEELSAVRERYRRLEVAARAVVVDARKAGGGGETAWVHTHLLRRVMRELDGEPQPSAFYTMSAS